MMLCVVRCLTSVNDANAGGERKYAFQKGRNCFEHMGSNSQC